MVKLKFDERMSNLEMGWMSWTWWWSGVFDAASGSRRQLADWG